MPEIWGGGSTEELAGRKHCLTNEHLTCSFAGPEFNNHVVLPDGTVLLCCMDYGMQHVLGNLKTQTYDEIRNNWEMKKIFQGAQGDESVELLCRKCLSAVVQKEGCLY